jgi:hypothetical protein
VLGHRFLRVVGLAAVLAAGSCARFGPVYPPRPAATGGAPQADPEPARVVVHVAVTPLALKTAVDGATPSNGEGTFPLLGLERHYSWQRGPFDVAFAQGRIVLTTTVNTTIDLPIHPVHPSFVLRVQGEPVVSATYEVRLQSVDVAVTSTEAGVQLADRFASVYSQIEGPLSAILKNFAYDLRPLVAEASARLDRPLELPLGQATACARLHVLEIEAAPTVLADGVEKDLALVVAPSITLPCADAAVDAPHVPALSNVAALTPGPFTVTVPIAARYDELTRAMTAAFTDGRLYFSTEYPELYLENPEIYESQASLVLKLHLRGPVHKLGIDADLDGDIYLVGHPTVVDNELAVPDLEPTIETRSFLLSLKAMTDGDRIRDQARKALRLDIGARLHAMTDKLGPDLTFRSGPGCAAATVDRVAVTGVYPHADYLRVYAAVTARARVTAPCEE